MSQLYTIQDIEEIVNTGSHKRMSLHNPRGQKILGWNSTNKDLSAWWDRIKKILQDANLQYGNYQIIMKRSASNDSASEVYEVAAGRQTNNVNLQEPAPTPARPEPDLFSSNNPMLLNYIQLQREIAEAKTTNIFLERENARLQAELINIQNKLEDSQADYSELSEETRFLSEQNKPSVIESTATSLMPFIEKYFEIQEKKLSIEQKKQPDNSEIEKKYKQLTEFCKLLVSPIRGHYLNVKIVHISDIMDYFDTPQEFAEFIDEIKKEDPAIADLMVEKLKAYQVAQGEEGENNEN